MIKNGRPTRATIFFAPTPSDHFFASIPPRPIIFLHPPHPVRPVRRVRLTSIYIRERVGTHGSCGGQAPWPLCHPDGKAPRWLRQRTQFLDYLADARTVRPYYTSDSQWVRYAKSVVFVLARHLQMTHPPVGTRAAGRCPAAIMPSGWEDARAVFHQDLTWE